MASAVKQVNPGADVIGSQHSLLINISAAKSLQEIVKSNLGPKGTVKMLVSGAGDIKVTKDGKVLLDEMQILHPTAAVIARTATAQDEITGDGTTSTVVFIGELLGQCQRFLAEGAHPRHLVDGIEAAREDVLKFLETFQTKLDAQPDRELLTQVARTALRTKVTPELADHLTEIVVNAVLCIQRPEEELDLHMVEIMHMRQQSALDTRFVDGLVLDHGARHPDMPKRSENCHILILNVSLEYEKTEVNSGFYYHTAEERARLAAAERKYVDDKVHKIVQFAQQVRGENKDHGFIVINQKGIDPISLDILQKANIVGIRRAKRRNMERLARACGGYAVNSVEDLKPECLGFAKLVYEHQLGDDKYTFVEGCKNPTSCTILIRGPNDHTIRQVKDAVHDGLRAVANLVSDKSVTVGAGAFELAAHVHLLTKTKNEVQGRAKLGVQVFADALLAIPKTLALNSGLDAQVVLLDLLDEVAKGNHVGVDIETGKPCLPDKLGIWDNTRVKKQFLHLGTMIATKLLLVDEIIRAGRKMGKE